MNTLQMKYKDAFVLMAGSACTVMLLNDINRLFGDPIPGFQHLAWLARLILFLWAGLLAGSKMNPRRWVTGLFALATLACLYMARHYDYPWQAATPWLHLMMFGVGILWPGSLLERASEEKGWDSLMLLLVAVFCFTAHSVVMERIFWGGGMMPEHRDMQRLMQGLTRNADPLMTLLAGYFAVRFSFSEWGRRLGSSIWFRGSALVPAVIVFLFCLIDIAEVPGFYYWSSYRFMLFLVQPVTVWLVVSVVRKLKIIILKSFSK